jgi:hypothetical protein
VGGCRDRETRRRVRVRMRRSTASAEGTELTGQAHSAVRRKGRAGAMARHWRTGPVRQKERERANGRRKLAPTGRPHWAASERGRVHARVELPLTGGVRLSGSAGARPGWA